MLVVTSLCLFACCSCHWGFVNARSEMSVCICMLLLPSGLCRCLNFVVHASLAIGALQVLVVTRLCLFACCYCHEALQMLECAVHAALAIGALRVLVVTSLCLFACCSCHRGFAGTCS